MIRRFACWALDLVTVEDYRRVLADLRDSDDALRECNRRATRAEVDAEELRRHQVKILTLRLPQTARTTCHGGDA